MTQDIASLVDADRGLIGRRIYIEPEIYEQEAYYLVFVQYRRAQSSFPCGA
jgi:hypothetical protein